MRGYITSLCVLATLASDVRAAGSAGQAGAFLRLESDARGAAMGGALTAISDDAGAIQWNPAGLSRLAKPEVDATHVTLFEDTSYDFVAGGASLKRYGGLAAAYLTETSGGFEARTTPFDAPTSFSVSQSAAMLGWGLALPSPLGAGWITNPKPIEAGVALKSVDERIDQASASGTGADAGIIFRPQERVMLGIRFQNLVAPDLTLASRSVSYSRAVDLSPAYLWRFSDELSALAAFKLSDVEGDGWSPSAGVEVQYRQMGFLRLGYQDKGIATGFGVRFGNTRIDYTAMTEDLGLSNIISFSQRFGQTREELEETIRRGIAKLNRGDALRLSKAYLRKADDDLHDQRLADAVRDLEAALLWDPDNTDISRRLASLSDRMNESLNRQMIERAAALGRRQYEQGNFFASRQYWESVLELDPRNPEAADFLRRIDQRLTEAERSKIDGLRKEEIANEVQQHLTAAEDYLSRSIYQDARQEAKKAEQLLPEDARIQSFLVRWKQSLRDSVDARITQAEGKAENREYGAALGLLAGVLRDDPENARAAKDAEAFRELARKNVSPETRKEIEQLYYRAVERYLKGDYAGANGLVQQILALDPTYEASQTLKEKIDAALKLSQ